MHINFPLLLNHLQKSELNQDVAEHTWSRLSKSSNNAESLRKSKKDAKAMLPDTVHKPAIDWAYSKLPNDNWAMWFLRNYKQDPSLFNEKNKTDLEHFAGMAATSKDVGDHRFDKTHDFNKGVADLKEKESSWQAKQGDKLVDKKGQQIIDLGNGLGWWDLGVGSCEAEGAAMGHCGNTAAVEQGDRILSLRQQKGNKYEPNLTFIENSGWLGEMKGRANEKPAAKYHGAIKTLLEHPRIKHIAGGGYADEMNFHMGDLPDDMRKEIEAKKPDLDLTASNDPETLRNTAKHLRGIWQSMPSKHRDLGRLIDLKADELDEAKANGKDLDQHLIDKYVKAPSEYHDDSDHDIFKLIHKTPENINEFAKSPNSEMQDLGLVHPLSNKEYISHLFNNPKDNAHHNTILTHKALDPELAKIFAKRVPVVIHERPELFNKDDIHDIIHSKEHSASARAFAAGHPEVSQDDLYHAAVEDGLLYSQGPDRVLKQATRETLDKLSNHYKHKEGPYRSVREAIALHPNADPDLTEKYISDFAQGDGILTHAITERLKTTPREHSDRLINNNPKLENKAYLFPNADPEKVVASIKNYPSSYYDNVMQESIYHNKSLEDKHLAELISGKHDLISQNLFTHPNAGPETLKARINHPRTNALLEDVSSVTNNPHFGPDEAKLMYNKIQIDDDTPRPYKDFSIGLVFLHPKAPEDLKHKILDEHPSTIAKVSAAAPESLTPEMSQKLIDHSTADSAHQMFYNSHPILNEKNIKTLVDKHGSDPQHGAEIKANADYHLKQIKALQKSLRSRYEKLKR